MNLDDVSDIHWLEPWVACAAQEFEKEAKKEIAPGHALYGQRMFAIGRREDCDDVLFFLPDNKLPLAVVHLTWNGKRENNSTYPVTGFFSSLSDWIENCMKRDHEDLLEIDSSNKPLQPE